MNVQDYEKLAIRLENFIIEIEREYYLTGSGQKDSLELTPIYEKYKDLCELDLIKELKEFFKNNRGELARRAQYLLEALAINYEMNKVKTSEEKIQEIEAQSKVKLPDGREVNYRYAQVVLMNEPNRQNRKFIEEERKKVQLTINPVLEDAFHKKFQARKELGYDNYRELTEELSGINLVKLRDEMQNILESTEEVYADALSRALKDKLDITLDIAEKHDMAYFMRGKEFDKLFKKEELVNSAKKTLLAMGINLDELKNIRLDIEPREKKSPRAFCSPVVVPDEIYLCVMPKGGHQDYSSFLHELGHSLHFGFASKNLPPEYRLLGDNSVTEGFAFTLEYFMLNPDWLKWALNIESTEYLRYAWLCEAYMLRRYCAKIDYEVELFADENLEAKSKIYRKKLESACKVKYPEHLYLIDVDPNFYCARYLRAWIFEALLEEYLKTKFGKMWFTSPECGKFFIELWGNGQRYTADELAKNLGYDKLDPTPLIDRAKKFLA